MMNFNGKVRLATPGLGQVMLTDGDKALFCRNAEPIAL